MRGAAGLGALLAIAACSTELPPEGQIVLHLDTDAPLEAASLFDRMTVEIFPPGASAPCSGCARELAIDVAKVRDGTFSFGFVPPPRVVGYVARLRMFRSAGRGVPRRASTVELVGYLPAVAEDGVVHLTARFRTEDVGRPRGSFEAPIVFDKGAPAASAEGSWAPGLPVDCTRSAPERTTCFPGGAFFMGDPRVTPVYGDGSGTAEHLVVLSPFHLDDREVTVGDVRRSGLALLDSRGRLVDPADGARETGDARCTYELSPGAAEDLPVNCVSFVLAEAYCRARGGDLPTEAQLEMAASARGTRLYPWGDRDPTCKDAAIARAPVEGGEDCQPGSLPLERRPSPAGSGALDRVGDVVDLAANLREWTRDVYAPDDQPCWASPLLVDPICEQGDPDVRSTKGGELTRTPLPYAQERGSMSAATRRDLTVPTVGFRCAYPGK